MTDFETLIRPLVDEQVEFVVVGGVAATAHGSARLTSELEVVAELECIIEEQGAGGGGD